MKPLKFLNVFLSLFTMLFMSLSAQAIDCNNPQNQNEITTCAYNAYKAEDAKLNTNYKKAMSTLPENVKKSLKETQRLWITYKEKHCELMTLNWEGGTGRGAAKAGCLAFVTKFQNKELIQLIEQYRH